MGDSGKRPGGGGRPVPPRRTPRRHNGPDRGPRPLAEALDDALERLVPPGEGRSQGSEVATAVTDGASTESSPRAPGPSSSRTPADQHRSLGALFGRWEVIAGPALARHVRPLRVSAQTLVVEVDHPAWATEVRALSGALLARVGEVAGLVPARLQVRVKGP